jgi:hypothetical protein
MLLLTNSVICPLNPKSLKIFYFGPFGVVLSHISIATETLRSDYLLLVEMLMVGNENLHVPCFCGWSEDSVSGLRERFCLDLNDRACTDSEYCNALIDESLENWVTFPYHGYCHRAVTYMCGVRLLY